MPDDSNRDSQTADKLIEAGIELFGEHGFRGTTTRMIAEAAGANIGSIAYYFDNKQGLYLAAARYISARLRARLELDAMEITYDHANTLTVPQARHLLELLVRRMVRLFMEAPEARRWLLLLVREQTNPTEAFEILFHDGFERAHVVICTLVGVLMDTPPSDRRVILQAHTLVGQIVFFLVGRTPLLRRLDCGDEFDPETVALAERMLLAVVAGLGPAT